MFLQLETAPRDPKQQCCLNALQDIIAIYLRWPSSWRYLDLLHRADESQK